ncbi:MAG: diguanylate cyclase [Fervidobacterium sp.]
MERVGEKLEIIEFVRETYWSKDYIAELDGRRKIVKFVKENLILRPDEVVMKSELARNVYGLLLPERFIFENVPILIYDVNNILFYDKFAAQQKEVIVSFLLSLLKNILHVPKLFLPILGFDDIVQVDNEILIFLPFVQNYGKLSALQDKDKENFFIAPEILHEQNLTDSSTLYVFGKLLDIISEDEVVKAIAKQLSAQDPKERKFKEDIPFSSILKNKKTLALKRIVREEEKAIIKFITSKDTDKKFLGVIGTQRIGKTTIVENIENVLREIGTPFLHAMSGSDVIIQTLQLVSDKISKELLEELTECIEKTCKIDTVSMALVQALSVLSNVVILVDDYHEVPEALRALLRKMATMIKGSNIKIIAFSVENFEEFEDKINLTPFSVEQTKELLETSFSKVWEADILSQWLTNVSVGLPGLIVEYIKYLYENDVIYFSKGELRYDIDKLEQLQFTNIFSEKLNKFIDQVEQYVSVLGQKFNNSELKELEAELKKKIDVNQLISDGVVYKEYDKYRFTLRQYWEFLYNSIPSETRNEIHRELSKKVNDTFKKAWHLEMIGEKISAATVYLKYIKELLEYYASPSLVKSVIRKVKEIIGNRTSYALVKFEVELLTRTEEITELITLKIPENRLFSYYIAKKYFSSYKEQEAMEILSKYPKAYGSIGEIKRKLLYLMAEFEVGKRRKEYVNRTFALIANLREDNPIHASILVDAYIFISRVLSDNPHRAFYYLKKAEKIALDFNLAHKLPIIYNNMSTESSNTNISMTFLQRAVDVANDIGLPARGYMAKLNMLYHALYAGKIKDFVTGIANVRPKIELLGLANELEYSHVLEAYYHAYNFEYEEALVHIGESEKISGKANELERMFISAIVRKFDSFNTYLSKIDISNLSDDSRAVVEILENLNSEELWLKWEKYINSGGRIFREEICAIAGDKLSRLKPELFRKELEYLENKFVLDGSLLSLAMVYEGYGHYYKEVGKFYKANIYYQKAITLYKDIGMLNASRILSQTYNVSTVDLEPGELEDTKNLSIDILTSLKVIDPKTDPQILLDYFVSKVLTVFPVKNVYFKIHDEVLDRDFESGWGEFRSFEKDYLTLSPLEIYLKDNFDQKSKYEIYASNQTLSLPESFKNNIMSKLEIIEYGFVAVFKGVLTRMRSYIDPLTKLFTRYYFSELLAQHFENAVNQKDSLSIVMCDIDNFKKINDTYGHLTGDKVLKVIAKLLRENIRSTDIVGRFGGEEFIISFPSTDVDETKSILERLRRHIRDLTEFPFKITLSFGVVNYPENTDGVIIQFPEDLIRLADTALYHAKNTGKDKIVVYSEGMTGGLHA